MHRRLLLLLLPPPPLAAAAAGRYVSVLGLYALIALYAVAVLVHNLACLAWLVALMEGKRLHLMRYDMS